jgi:hypothetical protein
VEAMRLIQVGMTCILAVVAYFLLEVFIGFDRLEPWKQTTGLVVIVGLSFLVARKSFP